MYPKVSEQQLAQNLGQSSVISEGCWHQVSNVERAATGAGALFMLTEWQDFVQINWPAVAELKRQPAWLFDAHPTVDTDAARAAGLNVWCFGEDQP